MEGVGSAPKVSIGGLGCGCGRHARTGRHPLTSTRVVVVIETLIPRLTTRANDWGEYVPTVSRMSMFVFGLHRGGNIRV